MTVLGHTAYVFLLLLDSRFLPRGIERVYVETMYHGVFIVLILNERDIYHTVKYRHLNFVESRFLGEPDLAELDSEEPSTDVDVLLW